MLRRETRPWLNSQGERKRERQQSGNYRICHILDIDRPMCTGGESCSFQHDLNTRKTGKGRNRSPSPSRTPRRNSKRDGHRKGLTILAGTSPQIKEKTNHRVFFSTRANAKEDQHAMLAPHPSVPNSRHFQVASMVTNGSICKQAKLLKHLRY